MSIRPHNWPDLLVLRETLPRDGWEGHPNFSRLTRFWLDRHLMFRSVLQKLRSGSQSFLDGNADLLRHGRTTQHYTGFLLTQLHGHHQIEDTQYFPRLKLIDPRLERGFDLLDADHHALDGILAGFAEAANGAIRGVQDGDGFSTAEVFRKELLMTRRLINRHLEDEEDLIVPVILHHGFRG